MNSPNTYMPDVTVMVGVIVRLSGDMTIWRSLALLKV